MFGGVAGFFISVEPPCPGPRAYKPTSTSFTTSSTPPSQQPLHQPTIPTVVVDIGGPDPILLRCLLAWSCMYVCMCLRVCTSLYCMYVHAAGRSLSDVYWTPRFQPPPLHQAAAATVVWRVACLHCEPCRSRSLAGREYVVSVEEGSQCWRRSLSLFVDTGHLLLLCLDDVGHMVRSDFIRKVACVIWLWCQPLNLDVLERKSRQSLKVLVLECHFTEIAAFRMYFD